MVKWVRCLTSWQWWDGRLWVCWSRYFGKITVVQKNYTEQTIDSQKQAAEEEQRMLVGRGVRSGEDFMDGLAWDGMGLNG